MTLEKYIVGLGRRQMSAFARKIGVNPSTMYRYAKKGLIPSGPVVRRILAATRGAVTLEDLYRPTKRSNRV